MALNPDLISWIDVTPDTTISLLGGDRIIVRESLDEVIAKIVEFRRAIETSTPRYNAAAARIPQLSERPQRNTEPPPARR